MSLPQVPPRDPHRALFTFLSRIMFLRTASKPLAAARPPSHSGYEVVHLSESGYSRLDWRLRFAFAIQSNRLGPRTLRVGSRVIKYGSDVDEAEAEAMQFIADNTSVPVPKVLRVCKYKGITFIEMEFVSGRGATCWDRLTPASQQLLLEQLQSYMEQIRGLCPPIPGAVASVRGSPIRDHRIGTKSAGPFSSHDEFHLFLRMGEHISAWADERPLVEAHTKTYASKFTHGDLVPRNVLVDPKSGRISAIIDWDCAGWRPEYWEITKSRFSSLGTPDEWFQALERACGDSYKLQLKAEMTLWLAAEAPSSPGILMASPAEREELAAAERLKMASYDV